MNMKELQKKIYANKLAKGFNVTDIPLEFAHLYGEVAEAFEAWRKKKTTSEKRWLMWPSISWACQRYSASISKMRF